MVTVGDERWAGRLLHWKPWFRALPSRSVGHPRTRWTDDIDQLLGGDWQLAADDLDLWTLMEHAYVTMR